MSEYPIKDEISVFIQVSLDFPLGYEPDGLNRVSERLSDVSERLDIV